ncbi:MAG: efflux RND transporter permease subunit [Pseudomonadota bacterium]
MDTALYRRPRYLLLTVLMIVALGASTLLTIGRQEDPTITNLFATVITPFPGADPARVEALVTEKIEAELREISEIDRIDSVSRTGISSVQIELSQILPDDRIEQVWSEIRDALGDAAREFPAGAAEPAFDNDRTSAYTLIASIAPREGRAVPEAVLGRYAEALQNRLRQVPETRLVDLYGAPEEEIRVSADPERISALGLTMADVARAITEADAKVSAGRVRGGEADFVAEVSGEIRRLDRVREIPLTAGSEGRVLRVGDVAEVARTIADPPASVALVEGQRAVLVAARVEDDRQVDKWAANTRADIDAFRAELPEGLALEIVFDQSGYTIERLGEVATNLAIGVAIVVAVLFVSMGWRSALVVGAMLPLTSLLSLLILSRLGLTIHQMSVTGLVVALGLLVDAAIVATDEIRRRLSEGVSRLDAVGGAVKRLAIPLSASTLTTVLAFVPMAALPGPAGDFVGAIAISVIVMLFASLILALTVTPAIAGRLLPDAGREARGWWHRGISGGWLGRRFADTLSLAIRWPVAAMFAAAMPAIVGFAAFPTLTAQFFPGVERDQFYIQIETAAATSLAETQAAAEAADALLKSDQGVLATQWVIGRDAPSFYYNMLINRDGDQGFAEALVTTRSREATEAAIPRLQAALDQALPGVRTLVRGLKQGPPVAAPIELRLVGPSLDQLRALGEQARRRMQEVPEVTHTRANLSGGAPKLVFRLDEDRLRLAGLTPSGVARQIQAYTEGALGGSLIEGPEELPVRVRLSDTRRADVGQLADLTVLPEGAQAMAAAGTYPGVPLASLGTWTLEPAREAIARKDGERVNTVQAFILHGILPEEALARLRETLAADPIPLPPGYRIEWGGETDARGETINNLLSVVGLVVAASVATIVLTFNAWRLSAVTGVVAILSMGLSILALAVFRYPFGIQALIGVIGAIGVSINAAIIILTALQEDDAAARGQPEAIRAVVLQSSRHILSTTVTTFGGFLPLILAGGGFWPPFAMAIAGGVLLSAIVSFYFVPAAYALLTPRREAEPAYEAPPQPSRPLRLMLGRHRTPARWQQAAE